MSITIKGDLAQLTGFSDRLQSLHEVLPKAASETGQRGAGEIRKNFSSKRNPYGVGWAPRTRAYAHPLMRKTKALLGSVRGWGAGNLFKIGFSIGYGIFHQSGTRKMVQRMLIPEKSKGIPDTWEPWIGRILDDLMKAHLGD